MVMSQPLRRCGSMLQPLADPKGGGAMLPPSFPRWLVPQLVFVYILDDNNVSTSHRII